MVFAILCEIYLFPSCQTSLQGVRELLREVMVLGSYRHRHLVPLVCFSLSRQGGHQEACLVYPLMPGGPLDRALADRAARPLGAAARLRIAADAAAGLAYLHAPGGGLGALLHRDVKSSNVLLDEALRARVADVGLARPQRGATMTAGVGTFGYIDPEYVETGERPLPPGCLTSGRNGCWSNLNLLHLLVLSVRGSSFQRASGPREPKPRASWPAAVNSFQQSWPDRNQSKTSASTGADCRRHRMGRISIRLSSLPRTARGPMRQGEPSRNPASPAILAGTGSEPLARRERPCTDQRSESPCGEQRAVPTRDGRRGSPAPRPGPGGGSGVRVTWEGRQGSTRRGRTSSPSASSCSSCSPVFTRAVHGLYTRLFDHCPLFDH